MDHSFSDSDAPLIASELTVSDEIPEEPDMFPLPDDAEQSGGTFAPPPRIAARFYRSSNNRRKSSAASSRRNSISSTHSHTSNRSFRSTCQNHHVAQHLRRASILESRKARLADRAAHAEQVRLRAALAKATPRNSNSEERVLAAQQARERHLAQVAAACAEEVRRAKKVAEDMKERKAAEERRYRLEMEERLAEAEKRRLEYKRNMRRPRTASSPTNESKKAIPKPVLTTDAAAERIQHAWRTRTRRKLVDGWLDLGLSIDKVHATSFEDITALLAEDKVLTVTEKIMSHFGLLSEGDATSTKSAVRTFLSTYLILGHPAHVLSRDGDQEQDLITKAKDLIISFESALSKLAPSNRFTPSPTWLETVSLAHGAFMTAFNDWKARDSTTLIETMIASFVSLDAIWQSVKDDTVDEVANEYRNGIRDNQAILLSKIKKLAGPDRALALIRKAIRESRRSRPKKKPAGEIARPRVAIDSASSDTPISEESARAQNAAVSELSESNNSHNGHQANSLSKVFTVVPTNRVLVHELSIDKEYRVDASPTADLRDALNRELCDAMCRGFETGEGALWTVAMADNIRAKLLRLLKPGNSMHTLISETLDPDLINRQCSQGIFSYEKFFNFIASILPKLCAPFRDAEVNALATELREDGTVPEMIEKLFKLLHVIDLLSLDYSNFLLLSAAPTLMKEAAGYEQRMFSEDLEAGRITLKRTRRWWRSAAVNMHTEADRRDPWNDPNPVNRPTPQKIYARGLVDLAIATTALRDSELPETLELDRTRISRIRADALRITTIGGILLTAKNLLKRDVRSQWKHEANRVLESLKDGYLKDPATPSKILSLLESSHPMPPSTRAQLSSTINRLLTQAESGKLTDPVMKVLFQRLKTHIFNRVSASSSGERVKAASTATESLATTGLPEFVGQVGDIVEQLGRVSEVDRKAHGKWYEEIAEELERQGADGEELSRSSSNDSTASTSSSA
ncbi:Tcp11-domain-containing protein [Aaosphaeria arxii CBS 175.79]|uniref:Tcp11-domain-containing protein n=1 Tax=Aaosphaeria arxii CBS 175.79 TaxID=1450172 RepID=A0A6A5XYC3_9PLEO|nr:Tcp11-domain-containing protein [Aaosphaeria arxii CBS 175.79]KAF2018162.1 Tcp11-domain-containing protein [Aaosphaeria arxii CBS 175.79]